MSSEFSSCPVNVTFESCLARPVPSILLSSGTCQFDIPTLIIHGDDDQIVPIAVSELQAAKLVKNATLKIYSGTDHGLTFTCEDQFNEDLLAFLRS